MFDLNTLSLANLVNLYNELATTVGEKPVTKFSTKPIGIARFQKLLDGAGFEVFQQSEHVLGVRVAGTEVDEDEDTVEEPAPAPVPTKRAKKAPKAKVQRATYAETDVITVVALPKVRPDSNRAKRQAALVTGITVGAYLDAAVAANGKRSRHKFHADLLRFAKAGAVTIGPKVEE